MTPAGPESPLATLARLLAIVVLGLFLLAPAAATPRGGLNDADWRAIRAQRPPSTKGTTGDTVPLAQNAYLKANDAEPSAFSGEAVAISGDTVVVGAVYEDISNGSAGTDAGAAYVFVRNGTGWTQQARLTAHNAEVDDRFGGAVAISGDTIVVAAERESGSAGGDGSGNGATWSGAAYVFVRSGTSWTQQAYLKAHNAEPLDRFGTDIAISGETIVVGASGEDGPRGGDGSMNGNDSSGAAYVFVRSGTQWSQQAYLKSHNSEMIEFFGQSVAVSGDTIVVGAIFEAGPAGGDGSTNGNGGSGAAYVFVRGGNAWSQQAYLKAHNAGRNDIFGSAVAVSDDTIVVGASQEGDEGSSVNPELSGAAYVFVRGGGNWSQQAHLKAHNAGPADDFGGTVAISGDTLVIGARNEDDAAASVGGNNNAPSAGAAYVFSRSGTSWSQTSYLKAHNAEANDRFGSAVAMSGTTIVAGAIGDDDPAGSAGHANSAPDAGAAYVFAPSHAVQVSVSGLAGSALVLENNGGDPLPIASNGVHVFSTRLFADAAYAVTIASMPEGETCVVGGGDNGDGSGTMGHADVTLDVACSAITYAVDVDVLPGGTGAVVDENAVGFEAVPHGTILHLLATPAPGWQLAGAANAAPVLDCGNGAIGLTGDGDGRFATPPITAACALDVFFANQPPSFIAGNDPAVLVGSGEHTVEHWAGSIRSGTDTTPLDDSQQLAFELTRVGGNDVLLAPPTIDADGNLAFVPGNVAGNAVYSVVLRDDAGTDHGGSDASPPHILVIAVTEEGVDLSIAVTPDAMTLYPRDVTGFLLTLHNAGPFDAMDAVADWQPGPELVDVAWTCDATPSTACTVSGNGAIADGIDLPANTSLVYHVTARLADDIAANAFDTTATVTPAASQTDPDPSDDSVTWTIRIDGVFRDGMEPPMP